MTVVRASTATATTCAPSAATAAAMGPTAEAASQRPATRFSAAGRARVLKLRGNRNSLAFAVHYLIVDQMGFSFIFKNKQISFYFLINNCSYYTNIIYDVYNTDII